jgi:hypothetical protein
MKAPCYFNGEKQKTVTQHIHILSTFVGLVIIFTGQLGDK